MSLFIETPQQEQLRLLREQREQLKRLRDMPGERAVLKDAGAAPGVAGAVASAEDTSQMARSLLDQGLFATAPTSRVPKTGPSSVSRGRMRGCVRRAKRSQRAQALEEPYSIAQETYTEQLAFDRRRMRRRRGAAAARVLLVVILVPVLLFAAFVGSYALTCILNGASPQELVVLMGELFGKMRAFGGLVIAMFPS